MNREGGTNITNREDERKGELAPAVTAALEVLPEEEQPTFQKFLEKFPMAFSGLGLIDPETIQNMANFLQDLKDASPYLASGILGLIWISQMKTINSSGKIMATVQHMVGALAVVGSYRYVDNLSLLAVDYAKYQPMFINAVESAKAIIQSIN